MDIYVKKIFAIVAVMLPLFLIVEAVTAWCMPAYSFKPSWLVPLFFGLFYLGALLFVNSGMSGIVFARYIIGVKIVKIFASMLFVAILAFAMRENIIAAVLNFFIYYMLLLIPECAYGIYMKKHIK